jgi:hypothetical protein
MKLQGSEILLKPFSKKNSLSSSGAVSSFLAGSSFSQVALFNYIPFTCGGSSAFEYFLHSKQFLFIKSPSPLKLLPINYKQSTPPPLRIKIKYMYEHYFFIENIYLDLTYIPPHV